MSRPLFSSLLERAARWAAHGHRTGVRKGSEIPYITHPAAVAAILQKASFHDEHLLAAAWLHDVVEDTHITLDQLAAEFPPEVIELVSAMSERKTDDDGTHRPWRDRKTDHLRELKHASLSARALVLADKLHNLGTMWHDLQEGQDLWSRFNASRDDILWYHRAILEAVDHGEPELASLVNECRQLIELLQQPAVTPIQKPQEILLSDGTPANPH